MMPRCNALRLRQAKNLLALLMLSRGVPMLLAGDEVLRTQHGNNNAYCQDNELGWFDWRLTEQNADMLRYTRELIALRRRHRSLTINRYFTGAPVPGRDIPDVAWHGARLNEPLWHDPACAGARLHARRLSSDEEDLHVIFNMSEQALEAPLPTVSRPPLASRARYGADLAAGHHTRLHCKRLQKNHHYHVQAAQCGDS